MTTWRYMTIDLTNLLARDDDIKQLNDAGAEGWELIAVMDNGIAYMRRPDKVDEQAIPNPAAPATRRRRRRDTQGEV